MTNSLVLEEIGSMSQDPSFQMYVAWLLNHTERVRGVANSPMHIPELPGLACANSFQWNLDWRMSLENDKSQS